MEIMEIYNKLITSKKYYYYDSFSNRSIKDSLKDYDYICIDMEHECFLLCKYHCAYDGENTIYTWDLLRLKDYGKKWALTKEELVRKVRRND